MWLTTYKDDICTLKIRNISSVDLEENCLRILCVNSCRVCPVLHLRDFYYSIMNYEGRKLMSKRYNQY